MRTLLGPRRVLRFQTVARPRHAVATGQGATIDPTTNTIVPDPPTATVDAMGNPLPAPPASAPPVNALVPIVDEVQTRTAAAWHRGWHGAVTGLVAGAAVGLVLGHGLLQGGLFGALVGGVGNAAVGLTGLD